MREKLVIGLIRSAFGTAGEVKVESFSGETEHFLSLQAVEIRRGATVLTVSVEWVRSANPGVLMKFEGVASREAAAALRGGEILVPRSDAAELGEDEFYYADLENLEVILDGTPVGTINAVVDTGAHAVLEVIGDGRRAVLIPFLAQFFGEVDLERGTIRLLDGSVLE